MTVLLVGADQLGNIPKELKEHGCKELIHWNGRKKKCRVKTIPAKVDLVLVLHDFVNHLLMDNVKEQAKRRSLPICYCKRGISNIKELLPQLKGGNDELS